MNPRRLHGRRWDCPANSPFRPGAMEVSRLLETIDETVQVRYKSEEGTRRWKNACAEFHSRYDKLAFPGGFSHAVERLEKSDQEIIDLVLRFLEDRPYLSAKHPAAPLQASQPQRRPEATPESSSGQATRLGRTEAAAKLMGRNGAIHELRSSTCWVSSANR